MANYRAIASGNWSAGATWAGGAVPPNGEGHNIYSNNFTVTIDTNVNVTLITNASNAGTFVGGGTAVAGGGFVVSNSYTITANVSGYSNYTSSTLTFSGAPGVSVILNGNITGGVSNIAGPAAIRQTGAGTLTVNGNIASTNIVDGYNSYGIWASAGTLIVNGNLSTANANPNATVANNVPYAAIYCQGTNNLTINNATMTGGTAGSATSQMAIWQNSASSVVTLNNCIVSAGTTSPAVIVTNGSIFSNNGTITAANGVQAISASLVTAYGTFVYSSNGTNPVGGARVVLGTTPTNAYTQFALNGINSLSFVRYYTADNALGQANPTDVRSGVSYASGNLTGRLTVPARGSVALSVNYGPSMPFTATRSGTTATATLAYGYPLVVGDQITVTGASNSEWNSTYTVASVVSGTSVTFTVPATHSASAGTGALMQTTGTAVLDPAAVASAVWGAASRTITGGLVDTATTLTNAPASVTPSDIWSHASRTITGGTVDTLTNAPTVPTASAIASQVRTELSVELGRVDQNISSRLAAADYTAPSAAPTVAAIRTEMDSNSTKLANLDATVSSRLASSAYSAAPTTAQIATAVEGSLLNEADGQAVLNAIVGAIGNQNLSEVSLVAAVRADLERNGGKLDSIPTSSAPSASSVAGAVRTELGVELGRLDASVSSRLAPSGTLATVTNLTNAPASVTPSDIWSHATRTLTSASGPTAVQIRQEIDANSTKLDAAISSRMAASEATKLDAVKAKTDLLNTDRLANVATTNIVGTLLAQANS